MRSGEMSRFNPMFSMIIVFVWTTFTIAGVVVSSQPDSSTDYIKKQNPPDRTAGVGWKISAEDLNHSVSFGAGVISRLQRLENNLIWSDIRVVPGSPAHGQLLESAPLLQALEQGKVALVVSKATIHLMNKFCFKHKLCLEDCTRHIMAYNLSETSLNESCPGPREPCPNEEVSSEYRSFDGSCNHALDGTLGQSFTSYRRLLFPDYLDGVQAPRRSVHKRHHLPSPRKVSTEMVKTQNALDKSLTMAVMQWTQFVSHDLAHTVTSRMVHSGRTIECCSSSGGNLSPRYLHPFCAAISIPTDDEFYSKHNFKCMSYVRSLPALRPDCGLGPYEQLNQATHFLDASHIYGSEDERVASLRKFMGGLLVTSEDNGRIFLPVSSNPAVDCQVRSDSSTCFSPGDSRANSQPHLTVMHTIWLREHNRLATELSKINPRWNDEELYQEARRIVIAEIQHITYNDWLPAILGKKYVSKMSNPLPETYFESIDPTVSNSFASAAFRFSKSLMVDKLRLYGENRELNMTLRLADYFNKPMIIEDEENFDGLVRGLATQQCQKLDLDYAKDVINQLYGNGAYGYDVFSLDIQRGRDHGLPSYTAFRSLCDLPEIQTFEDLLAYMPVQAVKSLSRVYKDPRDIDLLVGGLSEYTDGDSLLGATFSCIISDQFLRTRYGDRYFYTNRQQPRPFKMAQLEEIEKTSLASIFCDNGDSVRRMQPNVFRTLSASNELRQCEDLPRLNLNHWKDNRT